MPFFPWVGLNSQITPPLDLAGSGAAPMFGASIAGDAFNRVELRANGTIAFGTGAVSPATTMARVAGPAIEAAAALGVSSVGFGLQVAEGSNAKQGTFVLAGAATTTVANTSVTANSRIFLTCQALGTVTAASTLAVSSRVAGTSFTVTPSQPTDTSTIAFEIFEPG